MQLINICLTNPQLLIKNKISKQKLYSLFVVAQRKQEYEYFFHTVKFLFIKLALKYLSIGMIEDALYLGVKTKLAEIINYVHSVALLKKDIVTLNLLHLH